MQWARQCTSTDASSTNLDTPSPGEQQQQQHPEEAHDAGRGGDASSSDGSAGLGPGSESEMMEALTALAGAPWAQQRQRLDPGLYLVATPIGNLQDITLRALSVLRSASVVLAEDTRHTGKLLAAYGIHTQMQSYHAHNERGVAAKMVSRMVGSGEVMALVSDAGMPGISDPGAILVQAAIEAGVRVVPVPGACAFIAAAVASGLSTESLSFQGFLPPKTGARRARLATLVHNPATQLFYAPPHGLRTVLEDMVTVLGGSRKVVVARELTKLHEEFFRSDLQGALEEFTRREPRGEIVLVVAGADEGAQRYAQLVATLQQQPEGDGNGGDGDSATEGATGTGAAAVAPPPPPHLSQGAALEALLRRLLGQGLSTKGAAREAARLIPGQGRKEAYSLALTLAEQAKGAAGGGGGDN
ncbi:hypothetical protein FOA52_011605 [Chlamydomonas sp. UWO 241]|nr:hypothetical protein FOA52_011605 [Chlamydomonas sp. UWO 241]